MHQTRAMSKLEWRVARTVKLTSTLIPNPANSGATLLSELTNARIAFDGGLVHIDPRLPEDVVSATGEFPVYAFPPAAVHLITYTDGQLAPFFIR